MNENNINETNEVSSETMTMEEQVVLEIANEEYAVSTACVSDCCECICSACDHATIGGTIQLTTNSTDFPQNTQWSSSNTSVATVSDTGLVTIHALGNAIISATINGGSTVCTTVYGVIADGLYNIKNVDSAKHVAVNDLEVFDDSASAFEEATDSEAQNQMWKIKYIGSGQYSIRTYLNSRKGLGLLDLNSTHIGIIQINTTDTVSGVKANARWSITKDSNGYIIENTYDGYVLSTTASTTNNGLKTSRYNTGSDKNKQRWQLNAVRNLPNDEIVVFDIERATYLSNDNALEITVGDYYDLRAAYKSVSTIEQSFIWISTDNSVATLNAVGGIIASAEGSITVIVKHQASSTTRSLTVKVNKLLVYQTAKTYYEDGEGNPAEDLQFADMTEDELCSLDWLNWSDFGQFSYDDYRKKWEEMCTTFFAQGKLKAVILNMISHFMGGTGSCYSNQDLTDAILAHSSTQTYINSVHEQLRQLISDSNGDISKLIYIADQREYSLLRYALYHNNIDEPVYNTASDKVNGLTICVDSLWGNKIEITSFNVSNRTYTCKLHFTFYDHFGLDKADVEKYGLLVGFRAWYILQHYSQFAGRYRPYLTMIEFDTTLTGTY